MFDPSRGSVCICGCQTVFKRASHGFFKASKGAPPPKKTTQAAIPPLPPPSCHQVLQQTVAGTGLGHRIQGVFGFEDEDAGEDRPSLFFCRGGKMGGKRGGGGLGCFGDAWAPPCSSYIFFAGPIKMGMYATYIYIYIYVYYYVYIYICIHSCMFGTRTNFSG